VRASIALLLLCLAGVAGAHPEDELCVPGEDGMDPELCALLAEMNSSEGALDQSNDNELLAVLDEQRGFVETLRLYVGIGIGHILPDGLDHILFVLAVFLASVRVRALIWQISAYLVFTEMTWWRPAVVFGFGLIHGLGFAGFFGELGLPPGQFWSALIGFNVGVEIGQLSVILVAAIVAYVLRRWLRDPAGVAGYRSWIVRPGSALIGLTGLWWGVTRLL
jgi:hypothetical protein